MFAKNRLYLIYQLIPFFFTNPEIKNKYNLMLSLLLKKSNYKIIMKNNVDITIPNSSFLTLLHLFHNLRQCVYYNLKTNGMMEISFDFKNKFSFNLKNLNQETKNLLYILQDCIRYGGSVITPEDTETIQNKKTLKLYEIDNQKIIETHNGVKFYVKNFVGGIIETFVMGIHEMNDNENWNDKIVVDVGASVGDTPLYYASKGAKVYAFEIDEYSYNQMLENIELNPQYSKNIIPIHGGIGSDNELTYFSVIDKEIDPSATMFSSHFKDGTKSKKLTSQGYTLKTAYNKFGITHVDLLKMDCKGCEFALSEDDLKNVKTIKIEYNKYDDSHKIQNLLKLLKNSGFQYRLFKHLPLEIKSFNDSGNIYAYKINN